MMQNKGVKELIERLARKGLVTREGGQWVLAAGVERLADADAKRKWRVSVLVQEEGVADSEPGEFGWMDVEAATRDEALQKALDQAGEKVEAHNSVITNRKLKVVLARGARRLPTKKMAYPSENMCDDGDGEFKAEAASPIAAAGEGVPS